MQTKNNGAQNIERKKKTIPKHMMEMKTVLWIPILKTSHLFFPTKTVFIIRDIGGMDIWFIDHSK